MSGPDAAVCCPLVTDFSGRSGEGGFIVFDDVLHARYQCGVGPEMG